MGGPQETSGAGSDQCPLSLTYSLLTHELTALLEGFALDPYLGFLHQPDYGRPSLALDLVETFRHPVADRLVLTLMNRAILVEEDFQTFGDRPGVFLRPKAMKQYFAEYERWMLRSATRDGAPQPSFRAALQRQVENFVTALDKNSEFAPFRFDVLLNDEPENQRKEKTCNTSPATTSPTTTAAAT